MKLKSDYRCICSFSDLILVTHNTSAVFPLVICVSTNLHTCNSPYLPPDDSICSSSHSAASPAYSPLKILIFARRKARFIVIDSHRVLASSFVIY